MAVCKMQTALFSAEFQLHQKSNPLQGCSLNKSKIFFIHEEEENV